MALVSASGNEAYVAYLMQSYASDNAELEKSVAVS